MSTREEAGAAGATPMPTVPTRQWLTEASCRDLILGLHSLAVRLIGLDES